MSVVLWIVAGVLAVVFLGAGAMKLAQPAKKLADSGMGWVEDVSPGLVKTIGGLEVLAAVGLIVPPAVGVAPILAPLAATGLVVLMVGAAVVHARRHEIPMVAVNVVLLVLAGLVAITRFGPYAF